MFFWYLDYLLTLNCFIWGPEACVKCLGQATGLMHISAHRDCGRTHKTCGAPSQTEFQQGGREVNMSPTPNQEAICNCQERGQSVLSRGECYWLCQPYPRSDPLLVASLAKRSSAMAGLLVHLPLLFWDLCLGWSHTVPGRVSTTTVCSYVQLPCCVLETLSLLVTCCFWSWEPFCLSLCNVPWALGRRSVI